MPPSQQKTSKSSDDIGSTLESLFSEPTKKAQSESKPFTNGVPKRELGGRSATPPSTTYSFGADQGGEEEEEPNPFEQKLLGSLTGILGGLAKNITGGAVGGAGSSLSKSMGASQAAPSQSYGNYSGYGND
jgi:hypothetical protein